MSETANAAAASLAPACFTPGAQTVHEHAEVCVDAAPRGSADMERAEMAPRHEEHAQEAAWSARQAEQAHGAEWSVEAALFVCICVAPRAAERPEGVVRQPIGALVSPLWHDNRAYMSGQGRMWHSSHPLRG